MTCSGIFACSRHCVRCAEQVLHGPALPCDPASGGRAPLLAWRSGQGGRYTKPACLLTLCAEPAA